jgi:hypothetical protein
MPPTSDVFGILEAPVRAESGASFVIMAPNHLWQEARPLARATVGNKMALGNVVRGGQGCPAGPPYGHALSLALAAYLGRKFSAAPNKRDADHAADAPTRGQ